MVYTAQGSQWTESRCTVASVEPAGSDGVLVRMKQPCFFNLLNKPCGQGTSHVTQIENVGAAGLYPGEWYLEWPSKQLFYAPLRGETRDNIEVVLPVSDGLLHASTGLSRVEFVNVTFEHDTWAMPNGDDGSVAA